MNGSRAQLGQAIEGLFVMEDLHNFGPPLMVAEAFRARDLQHWHLVLTKPGTPQPACRLS